MTQDTPPALRLLSRVACAAAFLLLVAGGLVTSTGSSLAVPDWPLAYGQVLPPMKGGVLFEHGHRLTAAAVGLLTWALSGWTLAVDRRRWVRNAASAAAFGILLQAVLGGVTVLYDLPARVSIAHACLGQTVFALLVVLAEALSPYPAAFPDAADVSRRAWIAAGAVYLQLVLGAVLRHTGGGLGPHLLGAAAASAAVLWAAYKSLSKPGFLLAGLLFAQVALGLAAVMARPLRLSGGGFWPVLLTTAHVVCGALLLASSVAWAVRSARAAR